MADRELSIAIVTGARRPLRERCYSGFCAVAVYAVLWGCLCSLAYLSTTGLVPLLAGGALTLALALPPGRSRLLWTAFAVGLALAALLFALDAVQTLDGCKALLNRLFTASQQRQAYEYDLLPLTVPDAGAALRWSLIPLGLLVGLLCGCLGRVRWLLPLPLAAFCVWAAWLGLSPGLGWNLALLIACVLPFLRTELFPSLLPGLLASAAFCAVILSAFPGEHSQLSAWDERMRDRLAMDTLAYTDRLWEKQSPEDPDRQPPPKERQFFRQEETAADTDGEGDALRLPLPLLLAILLTALLLFTPAVYSDYLKKKRSRNRAGLDSSDNSAGIRAAFLYGVRWMTVGGLRLGNRPYGDFAADVEALFTPELRETFERVLPLWQEAAYSSHPMGDAQREQLRQFAAQAEQTVLPRLGRRKRLWVRYIEAL